LVERQVIVGHTTRNRINGATHVFDDEARVFASMGISKATAPLSVAVLANGAESYDSFD
jgi:hypothetical protein